MYIGRLTTGQTKHSLSMKNLFCVSRIRHHVQWALIAALALLTAVPAVANGNFKITTSTREVGKKHYESSDHLGTVHAIVTDKKKATKSGSTVTGFTSITEATQKQYAFGGGAPGTLTPGNNYRYKFNGMERDDEISGAGNSYNFGARLMDPRAGRWMSTDAQEKKFPHASPYNFVLNNPIAMMDPDGNLPRGKVLFYDPVNNTAMLLNLPRRGRRRMRSRIVITTPGVIANLQGFFTGAPRQRDGFMTVTPGQQGNLRAAIRAQLANQNNFVSDASQVGPDRYNRNILDDMAVATSQAANGQKMGELQDVDPGPNIVMGAGMTAPWQINLPGGGAGGAAAASTQATSLNFGVGQDWGPVAGGPPVIGATCWGTAAAAQQNTGTPAGRAAAAASSGGVFRTDNAGPAGFLPNTITTAGEAGNPQLQTQVGAWHVVGSRAPGVGNYTLNFARANNPGVTLYTVTTPNAARLPRTIDSRDGNPQFQGVVPVQ